MSTKSRLQAMTAELVIPEIALPSQSDLTAEKTLETRFPPVAQRPAGFKTGPGQMLAFRGQMLEVESELATLRAKLEQYADSMQTRKIDTSLIDESRWANRHKASYVTVNFIRLKADIEKAGGNVQAIFVRPKSDSPERFEIIFGHRRYMACKEIGIPVLASICTEGIGEAELFAAMDRENRERADLSNFEQGAMYQRALDEGLHSSKRSLAEALGVSHTWVNNALSVANLPVPIVECFRNPLEITHRHARLINIALESDRKMVMKRVEKIRGKGLSASGVLAGLLDSQKGMLATRMMTVDGKKVGKIEKKGGSVLVNLNASDLNDEKLVRLQAFLEKLLSGNQVSTDN
jgi:ParB family chromosome partitioning protein